jgi:hypothetical protein
MKLIAYFDTLLTDTVNLSQSRLDQLDGRMEAIHNALADDEELGPYVVDKIPQGSRAQRTIITPPDELEYDADFLLQLEENPQWSANPESYIGQIYAALGRNGTYKDKRRRKCRCVRVTYANDCHIDVVAYLILADGRKVIVNGDENKWEETNPEGFTEWMKTRDQTTGRNLRKVIRLLKYLRDHKGNFRRTRSIIITTLVGNRVDEAKLAANPNYYSDVPTTLVHLVEDLDAWLQAQESMPSVEDPSKPGTTFDHRWDEDAYDNFRNKIHQYAADMRAAYDESDKDTSIKLWQDIFGDGFKAPPPKESNAAFGAVAAAATIRAGRAG